MPTLKARDLRGVGRQVQKCANCGESVYSTPQSKYVWCRWCIEDDKEEEGRKRDKDIDYMYDGN